MPNLHVRPRDDSSPDHLRSAPQPYCSSHEVSQPLSLSLLQNWLSLVFPVRTRYCFPFVLVGFVWLVFVRPGKTLFLMCRHALPCPEKELTD